MLLTSFAVVGIRFILGKVLGIASVKYYVVPSVIKVVLSLLILSITVNMEYAMSLGFFITLSFIFIEGVTA
jgi:hypothetical protein